ncbi:MAG: metal-sensing transcriptional repressor [Lachnospiraceae bacterium]
MDCKCHTKTTDPRYKHREEAEKKDLINRLNRIEGQIRGVKAMVEEDRYCVDVLTQVSAVQSAINGFCKELMVRHIKTCVVEDVKQGNEEAVNELCELVKKQMK